MSWRYETPNSNDLEDALKAIHNDILRLIDGFEYVKGGNLALLDRIEAYRSPLADYPQSGCATQEDIVAGINWSMRERRHPRFPTPPEITVPKAIEIAKALDRRNELTEEYVRRFSSTTAQVIIAFDDLKLAEEFHNRFLDELRPGRS